MAIFASAGAAPVITIDGPTASGKGTIAHRVAKQLGWDVLDSGALYRLTALAALRRGLPATDEPAVAAVAQGSGRTVRRAACLPGRAGRRA
ncbi:AAA domain protein [Bordetella pertussis CHLA-15]|nr:AAA domain protein [Bordetella pertussis CHLA-15]